MKKPDNNSKIFLIREFHGNEIAFGLAFIIPWAYIGIRAFLIRSSFTKLDWYLITATPLLCFAISFFLQARRGFNTFKAVPVCIIFTILTIIDSAVFLFNK